MHNKKYNNNDEFSGHSSKHDHMCIPLRQQDAGSSTFVVHFPNRATVVVTDPAAIKEIAMQPKNEKPRRVMLIFATLFGER